MLRTDLVISLEEIIPATSGPPDFLLFLSQQERASMKLGEVFQSIEAWRKLSSITMRPKLAYAILKYVKLITTEYEIAEKQRVALIHELTNTKEGEDARIEAGTPEFTEYVKRFTEIMGVESSLPRCELDFAEVVNAVDGKDDVLTVNDLALLEPFFVEFWTTEEEENSFRNEDGTPKMVLG